MMQVRWLVAKAEFGLRFCNLIQFEQKFPSLTLKPFKVQCTYNVPKRYTFQKRTTKVNVATLVYEKECAGKNFFKTCHIQFQRACVLTTLRFDRIYLDYFNTVCKRIAKPDVATLFYKKARHMCVGKDFCLSREREREKSN